MSPVFICTGRPSRNCPNSHQDGHSVAFALFQVRTLLPSSAPVFKQMLYQRIQSPSIFRGGGFAPLDPSGKAFSQKRLVGTMKIHHNHRKNENRSRWQCSRNVFYAADRADSRRLDCASNGGKHILEPYKYVRFLVVASRASRKPSAARVCVARGALSTQTPLEGCDVHSCRSGSGF